MDDFDDWLRESTGAPGATGAQAVPATVQTGASAVYSTNLDLLSAFDEGASTEPRIAPSATSSSVDDLEMLLASVSASASAATPDRKAAPETTRIPDPFDEFDISTPVNATAPLSAPADQSSSSAGGHTDDFLAWLDESPAPAPAVERSDTVSARGVKSLNLTPLVLPKSVPVATGSATSTVSSIEVNTFFDEVFGGVDDGAMERSNVISTLPAQDQQPQISLPMDHVNIEAEINITLESAFPDVARLRKMLLACGRIPASHRGKVWCLLLNGFYVEDQVRLCYLAV